VRRHYRYVIVNRRAPAAIERDRVWQVARPLDAEAMHAAAQYLVGTHDFESIASTHHGRESTVRTLFHCSVTRLDEHNLQIDVAGDGFLYNMVRILAGTLVEVGIGKTQPDAIPEILAAKDRRRAGPTLPPEGLCLMWAQYPEPDGVLGDAPQWVRNQHSASP
ncbi:MAG: tRNA pseudouridine synthase A, partial [Phycisphaerales bacterium]